MLIVPDVENVSCNYHSRTGEIELSGTARGLLSFAEFLLGDRMTADLPNSKSNQFSSSNVTQISKLASDGAINFHPNGDNLLVEGNAKCTLLLAESIRNLSNFKNNPPGYHMHFDSASDQCIDPKCQWELVVMLEID
ncbi:MAG TPA: hypothetical protein VHW02_04885 [Rhizomicrobium sp.]|jgi:hypothetical protein|nr:hypothetical protein [Rhizomicrobium sp.]